MFAHQAINFLTQSNFQGMDFSRDEYADNTMDGGDLDGHGCCWGSGDAATGRCDSIDVARSDGRGTAEGRPAPP